MEKQKNIRNRSTGQSEQNSARSSVVFAPASTGEKRFPDQVKIYPGLMERAIQIRAVNALRVWSIARSLDPNGSGIVSRAELYQFLDELGVNSRTRDRWIRDALNKKLFTSYHRRHSNNKGYILTGLERTAQLLGISTVGRFPVVIPSKTLVNKGYRSYLWGGSLLEYENSPISRKRLRQHTGVPERTQRRREESLAVERIHNIALTDRPADHISGFREHHTKTAFVYRKHGQQAVVAVRLPDIRVVKSSDIVRQRVGKSKRINDALRSIKPVNSPSTAWSSWGPGLSGEDAVEMPNERIFYESDNKAKYGIRRMVRHGGIRTGFHEVFVRGSTSVGIAKRSKNRFNVWRPVSV